ncbi:MAG: hypothetical protein AAF899_01695 [Pseudomonadota bacterium]
MTTPTRHRLAIALTAATLSIGLQACVAPGDAARVQGFRTAAGAALDGDRSRAARVAAGLGATAAGVSLGCTMLHDMPGIRLNALRAFCLARERITSSR